MHGAHNLLCCYAKKNSMNILMSNYFGLTWGIEAGVKSAIWNIKGNLVFYFIERNHFTIFTSNVCTKNKSHEYL